MSESLRHKSTLRSVLSEVLRGKSVGRTLTNLFWRNRAPLRGAILDIGGAGRGSHYRFIRFSEDAQVQVVDVETKPGVSFTLDITKERVPLPDGSQDHIFLFNILEHLTSPDAALREAHRLLKRGGTVIGTVPFLVNVHRDPEDYARYTDTALAALFARTGFATQAIEPIGRGPLLAAYEQLDMLIWNPLHLLFLPIVWFLDWFIQRLKPRRNFRAQFPLSYNFIVEKRV
jgi:SAM-dependent methyltransferase